ncbi:MAG: (Fe-S)-binding protein [Candidatus Korarchaeota archaeon]|nr:(Fe-S)-binding protein [Candidatus Korarchaeota archaeon]
MRGTAVPEIVKFASENTTSVGDVLGLGADQRTRWARGLLPKGPVDGTVFYAGEMYPVMGYAEGAFRALKRLEGFMDINSLAKVGPIMRKLGIYTVGAKVLWGRINERYERGLRDAIYVLKNLGIEVGYLFENEPPSGVALHTYGLLREFKEHAEWVHRRFRELGVRRVITLDPIVATAFRLYYPEFVEGWDVEALHFVEVVAREMAKKGVRLRLGREVKVTYHDPCYLARTLGVVDEIRFILSRIDGVKYVEPPRHGVNTGCSGDGGLELTQPPLARKVSYARIEELKGTGAQMVFTSCPACIMMLRTGFDAIGLDISVEDLASLVAEAMRNGIEETMPEEPSFNRYKVFPSSPRPKSLELKDLAEMLEWETDKCKKCGFCNVECPTAKALDRLESRSARGRMTLINSLVKGDPVRPKAVLDRLYSCVLCGQCSQACPVGLHVQELIVYGRAYAIYSGKAGVT